MLSTVVDCAFHWGEEVVDVHSGDVDEEVLEVSSAWSSWDEEVQRGLLAALSLKLEEVEYTSEVVGPSVDEVSDVADVDVVEKKSTSELRSSRLDDVCGCCELHDACALLSLALLTVLPLSDPPACACASNRAASAHLRFDKATMAHLGILIGQ